MVAWFPSTKSLRLISLFVAGGSLTGLALYTFLYYSQHEQLPNISGNANKLLLAAALTSIVAMLLLLADRLLDRMIHWKDHFITRLASGLITHLLIAGGILLLINQFIVALGEEELLKLLILFTIILFVYEILYGLLYSYRYYAVNQAEQLRTERWQLELQFESLKSQISPHYLFNCLNTVSSLLYKDTREAEEFIRRMADTFRYVLAHERQQLVTLQEELDFVKAYYFLLQVRYEYLLQLEVNIPPEVLNSFIPPMTLQLLVENAVKHNRISKQTPLLVSISASGNGGVVTITNTKTPGEIPASGFRVGLHNIHSRYKFFTHQPVHVQDDERFTVALPIITNNRLLRTE